MKRKDIPIPKMYRTVKLIESLFENSYSKLSIKIFLSKCIIETIFAKKYSIN